MGSYRKKYLNLLRKKSLFCFIVAFWKEKKIQKENGFHCLSEQLYSLLPIIGLLKVSVVPSSHFPIEIVNEFFGWENQWIPWTISLKGLHRTSWKCRMSGCNNTYSGSWGIQNNLMCPVVPYHTRPILILTESVAKRKK